jgi:hypothetical protein
MPASLDHEYSRAVLFFVEAVEMYEECVDQRGAGPVTGWAAGCPLGESDDIGLQAADIELRAAVSAVELAHEILLAAWERRAQGQTKARPSARAGRCKTASDRAQVHGSEAGGQ